MKEPYHITLMENSKPYSITVPRRIALPLRDKVKIELERMVNEGIIERISEPTDWCAGIVVVPKKDNTVRICVDLTELNKCVKRERHQMPSTDELLGQLSNAKFFSKLDAVSGFWHCKLTEESAKLTTFLTPFGRFFFKRLPFGITSAPELYQRKMSSMLEGLEGVICLIDDVLIYGSTIEEHNERLEKVLKNLNEGGVTLNEQKCEFLKTKLKFLGHEISSDGISADKSKITAVLNLKPPQNLKELRSFFGMINYMRKFLPNFSSLSKPINDLLSTKNEWRWDEVHDECFNNLKKLISSPPVLSLYDYNKLSRVSADSSSYGIGGVLEQLQESGDWRPVAYTSRTLTETEKRYAQIEKEALALTWVCERFNDYVLGVEFTLRTDHKPLVELLGKKPIYDLTARLQRFRMRLMKYKFNIVHIPGKEFFIPDNLSRDPMANTEPDTDILEEEQLFLNSIIGKIPAKPQYLVNVLTKQKEDPVCEKLKEYITNGWPEKKTLSSHLLTYWRVKDELTLQNEMLLKGERLIIPRVSRRDTIEKIHQGHLGIVKCLRRARESVWWPGINQEIKDFVLNCQQCKIHKENKVEPLITSEFPERPWQKIGADFMYKNKKQYLVIQDYYSRFIFCYPMKTTTARVVTDVFRQLFAVHGIPDIVRTDGGPPFQSFDFKNFCNLYNIKHITSSPLYSQSNGFIESGVKTAKALLDEEDSTLAFMNYRATPLENGFSPAQLLFSRNIRTLVPVISRKLSPYIPQKENLIEKEEQVRERQKKFYNKRHRVEDLTQLKEGTRVWIKDVEKFAIVIQETTEPRSYLVRTEKEEQLLRRNRRFLVEV